MRRNGTNYNLAKTQGEQETMVEQIEVPNFEWMLTEQRQIRLVNGHKKETSPPVYINSNLMQKNSEQGDGEK